jgi:hypothetical protein
MSILHWASDGLYHGYFAEMERGCGLTSWETNSVISHATSSSPHGPWAREGTTLGVWSHTPSTAVAHDGTILLFHMGSGVGGRALNGSREYNASCAGGRSPCGTHPQHHCNESAAPSSAAAAARRRGAHNSTHSRTSGRFPSAAARPSPAAPPAADGPPTIQFHVATAPGGPWTAVAANASAHFGFGLNTPLVHPNGTVYVVTGDHQILRAWHWRGPYELVVERHACGDGEDNFLYIDGRGSWHCLYHRAPFPDPLAQGGHAFSADGLVWHASETPAYPGSVEYADGSVGRYGKRERPHLVLDPATRKPVALTNGVCLNGDWAQCNNNPWPGFFDLTFTTVAPIQQ